MAEAKCINDDCDKEETWTLRKPVPEYSGGVTCPECGSTRTEIHGEETANITEVQTANVQQAQTPAQRGGEGRMSGAEATLALLDGDLDRRKRAEGASKVLSFGQNLLQTAAEYAEQKDEAKRQQAQRASVEAETNYPDCPECGFTLTEDEIPLGEEKVRCPECKAVLRVNLPEQQEP